MDQPLNKEEGQEDVKGMTNQEVEGSASTHDTTPTDVQEQGSDIQDDADLREAILKQVEYYFAPEHLTYDPYLSSLMSEEMYVPIEKVAQLHLIEHVSKDISLITECLKESKKLEVDGTGKLVRPAISVQRKTLILRDVSPEATDEDIMNLFEVEGDSSRFGEIESVKEDIENTWFIVFENDAKILEALEHVHSKKLKGKQIMPRIKSESAVHSAYSPYIHPQQNQVYNYGGPNAQDMQYDYQAAYGQQYYYQNEFYTQEQYDGQNSSYNYNKTGGQPFHKYRRSRVRMKKDSYQRGQYTEGDFAQGNRGGKKGKKSRKDQNKQAQFHLGSQHFPPLPSAKKGKGGDNPGYKTEFVKYEQDDIRNIILSIEKPAAMPETQVTGFPLNSEPQQIVYKPLKEAPAKNDAAEKESPADTRQQGQNEVPQVKKPSFAEILQN